MASSATEMDPKARQVLDYWFGQGWATARPTDVRSDGFQVWFAGGPTVDAEITTTFGADCEALIRGDYDAWQQEGGNIYEALAGIIIGDQFCRNVYRGTAKMFAADHKVLPWAKYLVDSGVHKQYSGIQRMFVILPFMHSENMADQERCIELAKEIQDDMQKLEGGEAMAGMAGQQAGYGERHRAIIERFGRFPHRNAVLGRESTPEEVQGLADGTIEKF